MSEPSSHKPLAASAAESSSTGRSGPSSSARLTLPTDDRTVISSRPAMPDLLLHGQSALESGKLWEGEQLGQFILQQFVGGGGMGIVFRALDTTLDREVAVKVLGRDQSADDETLRRFRNEAQSAARLNHDNIARVFYVGEDRGVHYIVFEFIEGVNIRDLVEKRGPLPLEEAVSYTYQIALALEHASQRSVIHRDIKPSNVLITPDGKAKLVDMGLARLNLMAPATDDLTASGVTLGTFDYISPEQARDPRSADVRSDMYSLGCSFFYMLTARPPFPEGTVLQKLLQHQADPPPDPRQLRPELPLEVNRVLSRLLAKVPAQRFQRPAELIDALANLASSLGLPLATARPVYVAPRRASSVARWQHHLPWVVPLAALFLIVLGLDYYWGAPRMEPATAATLLSPQIKVPSPKSAKATSTQNLPLPAAPGSQSATPVPAPPQVPAPDAIDSAPSQDSTRQGTPVAGTPDNRTAKPRPALPGNAGEGLTPEEFVQFLMQFNERLVQRAKGNSSLPSTENSREPLGPDDLDLTLDPAPGEIIGRPAETRPHVLVVGDQQGPNRFDSLHRAVSEAKTGDTIELRYNGSRMERPLVIANLKLKLKAAEGFRPVVLFRPEPQDIPTKYPPAMISVAGGQFSASGIHWELELPKNEPADWALFEARRAESLEFQNCTFTIRGQAAYHAGVAFFDLKAPPGGNSMEMGGADAPAVAISLQNCIARGEASFLRDHELQGVRLNWDNGLLATSQWLFVASGSSVEPRQQSRAELILRHVTVAVGEGGVLLTDSQDAPYQLRTEVRCDDCILVSGAKNALVEQRGSEGFAEYQTRFEWSGERDYLSGFETLWRMGDPSSLSASRQLDFAQWQEFWREQSRGQQHGPGAVVWQKLPGVERPYHAHLPADYALDASAGANAALGGASDGLDAGALAAYLPSLAAGAKAAERATSPALPADAIDADKF